MNEPGRKRGRPRVLDREAGLEVAARLFWEHGYEGTSIADLTRAMGVTPPSLYAIFGSKEQLYQQALDHSIERDSKRRSEALQSVAEATAARREASIQCLKARFDRAVSEGELADGTDTDSLARFYGALVQGMSAQACDGACTERLKRLVDIALSAWPGDPAYRKVPE